MKNRVLLLVAALCLMPLVLMGQNRKLCLDTECELKGNIGGNNPVTMKLLINKQGDVMGSCHYDKSGPERTLNLNGKIDGEKLYLEESNNEDLLIGSFEGTIYEPIEGTWVNKLNGMALPFSLKINEIKAFESGIVPPPPPPVAPAEVLVLVDDEDVPAEAVEEMPKFPGGQSALMSYIAKSVKYPKAAQESGTQGRVIVQFYVERDGSITNATAVRSVSRELDAEALRIINAMPKWTPGKKQGKAVRVQYTVPVNFRLH